MEAEDEAERLRGRATRSPKEMNLMYLGHKREKKHKAVRTRSILSGCGWTMRNSRTRPAGHPSTGCSVRYIPSLGHPNTLPARCATQTGFVGSQRPAYWASATATRTPAWCFQDGHRTEMRKNGPDSGPRCPRRTWTSLSLDSRLVHPSPNSSVCWLSCRSDPRTNRNRIGTGAGAAASGYSSSAVGRCVGGNRATQTRPTRPCVQ